jgi:hypothetical protein
MYGCRINLHLLSCGSGYNLVFLLRWRGERSGVVGGLSMAVVVAEWVGDAVGAVNIIG